MRRRVQDGVCEVDCIEEARVVEARGVLPPERASRGVAEALKVLAHPGRLRVLHALDGRELCVCDLARVLGSSVSGTSQQLRQLRHLGAVDFRVAGRLVYYTLTDRFWLELAERVAERIGMADVPAP